MKASHVTGNLIKKEWIWNAEKNIVSYFEEGGASELLKRQWVKENRRIKSQSNVFIFQSLKGRRRDGFYTC